MHDKKHNSLKAAKYCEQIRHGYGAPLKLETAEDPHEAQNAHLSHCSDGECPAGGNRDHRSVSGHRNATFYATCIEEKVVTLLYVWNRAKKNQPQLLSPHRKI